jgi:16S rRNA (guanine527-N7)-methyltransferase
MKRDMLIKTLSAFGLDLSGEAVEKLNGFVEMVGESSQSLNLLASGEIEHIWERHVLDSLWPLILGVVTSPARILDVGTGAGFPGIPLAIVAQNSKVTMVESNGKKARFVERVLSQLKIENACVINQRIEKVPLEEPFDYALTRAFSSIGASLPILEKFMCKNGSIIFLKGPDAEREIAEAEKQRTSANLASPEIIKIPPEFSPKGFCLVIYRQNQSC